MTFEMNKLGKSSVLVSEMGFGGAPLGGIGRKASESEAMDILKAAFDAGISYFDTAPLYGHGLSERRIGRFLNSITRSSFVISTKVGRMLVSEGEGQRDQLMQDNEPFSIVYDYSYQGAKASLEASIERLGIDHIDLLLCHDIDRWTHGDGQPAVLKQAQEGILRGLCDLRSQGVIKAFGLGVNDSEVCSQVMNNFDVDCFLLAGRFTLLEQEPLDDLLPRCLDNNVSIIVGGPYNSGVLANVKRNHATYDYKPVDDLRWEKAQKIRTICDSHVIDMRAAALQFPLKHPAVVSIIPGVWRMKELRSNLDFFDVDIPDALWRDLAEANLVRLDGIEI
ncbi:MAG: pyridoxal 4-dehydrogenase [Gammaproteobacteria bacterium]|uniref:Aldo/keto reductase n=1 Tax=OM182 bacterium TaxID=2510334 RepID=A0A520RY50_9GAMM|nr:pyridoxal 4-dehydrogenase [Gammaproteobacteria bacterium]RZO75172.1 MAG: aldo/keto reductase [OM182 bacterium]